MKATLRNALAIIAFGVLCGSCIAAQAPVQKALSLNERELLRAVETQDIERVTELLKQGVSPNLYKTNSKTLLGRAVETGNLDIVKLLVRAGADIDYVNTISINLGSVGEIHTRSTALGSALSRRYYEIAQYLIENGADPHQRIGSDESLITPLEYLVTVAVSRNDAGANDSGVLATLRYALEHGADPDAVGPNDYAPLDLAVGRRNEDVMALLVCYGASSRAPKALLHGTIDVSISENPVTGIREWAVLHSVPFSDSVRKSKFTGICN